MYMAYTTGDVMAAIQSHVPDMKNEFLSMVSMDKNRPIRVDIITLGTFTGGMIQPKEVYKHAILEGASSILIVHNVPEKAAYHHVDWEVSEKISQAGQVMEIPMADYIVAGKDRWISMAAENKMKVPFYLSEKEESLIRRYRLEQKIEAEKGTKEGKQICMLFEKSVPEMLTAPPGSCVTFRDANDRYDLIKMNEQGDEAEYGLKTRDIMIPFRINAANTIIFRETTDDLEIRLLHAFFFRAAEGEIAKQDQKAETETQDIKDILARYSRTPNEDTRVLIGKDAMYLITGDSYSYEEYNNLPGAKIERLAAQSTNWETVYQMGVEEGELKIIGTYTEILDMLREEQRSEPFQCVRQNVISEPVIEKEQILSDLEMVKKDGLMLEHVKDQTEEIRLAAVRQNPHAICYCNDLSDQVCDAALDGHKNDSYEAYYDAAREIIPDPAQQRAAVERWNRTGRSEEYLTINRQLIRKMQQGWAVKMPFQAKIEGQLVENYYLQTTQVLPNKDGITADCRIEMSATLTNGKDHIEVTREALQQMMKDAKVTYQAKPNQVKRVATARGEYYTVSIGKHTFAVTPASIGRHARGYEIYLPLNRPTLMAGENRKTTIQNPIHLGQDKERKILPR